MAKTPSLAPLRIAVLAPLGGLAIVLVGVLVNARAAVLLLGAFAIAGAVARFVTPEQQAFAVRSRIVDVVVLGVLGAALMLLGMTTPLG
ncbi:DUF3017 domain-containing protein [Demequina sp.]|uniref:DUF3017 domain-containing protein n=1 Tax=Demequina sp. TaxID=2050685 RepID=UPI003D0B2BA2